MEAGLINCTAVTQTSRRSYRFHIHFTDMEAGLINGTAITCRQVGGATISHLWTRRCGL